MIAPSIKKEPNPPINKRQVNKIMEEITNDQMIIIRGVFSSVLLITIFSIAFFIASIFDILFLPLAFYIWILLPVLLVFDLGTFLVEKYIFKIYKSNS